MRKVIVISFLMAMFFQSFAQTSSGTWNPVTATYTNAKHHITWELPDDFNWIGRPITDGTSTILKVKDEETQLMVVLTAVSADGNGGDIWDAESMFKSAEAQKPMKNLAKQNGMKYKGVETYKTTLCGLHAIATKTDMTKYHPEYDITVHAVFYSYNFYKRGYVYTATFSALSIQESELYLFGLMEALVFSGFSIE